MANDYAHDVDDLSHLDTSSKLLNRHHCADAMEHGRNFTFKIRTFCSQFKIVGTFDPNGRNLRSNAESNSAVDEERRRTHVDQRHLFC